MCVAPLDAWRTESGEIVFGIGGAVDGSWLQLPCGQCVECRLERSRQWAVRCMHEASLHDKNCFLTLTYNDENCPRSLRYKPDVQKFWKRLRKAVGPFRFFACGEYGEVTLRPHYHACVFGLDFADKVYWRRSHAGFNLYRSPLLERLWPFGYSDIGEVTFESAAYVARYAMKKVTGNAAAFDDFSYLRMDLDTGEFYKVSPEVCRMSKRPAIGLDWIRLYHRDVYRGDGDPFCVVDGVKVKPPRYYDQYVGELAESDEWRAVRRERALLRKDDQTPDRLHAREVITKARVRFLKRSLE